MGMEVIGLEAIDDGRALADRAILELQDCRGTRLIFVGLEDRVAALGGITGHLLNITSHAEQEGVERVTPRGQKRAAAQLFLGVPTVLSVPRPDAMVIIDFTVVEFADQALVDHRLRREELRAVTAFKTYADLHASRLRRLFH